jgi:hypothetical protein
MIVHAGESEGTGHPVPTRVRTVIIKTGMQEAKKVLQEIFI